MSKNKPQNLTRAVEKRITEDWARELPGMAIYKPRWLMRRVGPVLIGVCLDRDSHGDQYKPSSHIFFLGCKWPGPEPALVLNEQLLTRRTRAPDAIKVRRHEEDYREAVERIKEQALLPLDGAVTMDQVLEAYQKHHERTPTVYPTLISRIILIGDVILLLAWCNRKTEAEQILQEVLNTVLDESDYRHPYGSRQAFEQAMREAIDHPESLRNHVERQIKHLGVEGLPVSELSC